MSTFDKSQPKELQLLWDFSSVLTQKGTPLQIHSGLLNTLKTYFQVKSLDILLFDTNSQTLKDFTKSWIFIDFDAQTQYVEAIYKPLLGAENDSFMLNDKIFSFNCNKDELLKHLKKTTKVKENVLYFPLINTNDIFGFIKLDLKEFDTNYELLLALKIASYQVSSVIANTKLNEKLKKNVLFHKSMSGISKLIENQYELGYIIPLIGEMIDRFVEDHLIYIFTKSEHKKFKLLWPSSCSQTFIEDMLKQVTAKSGHIISADKKTGVFPLVSEGKVMGAVVAYSNIEKLSQAQINYLNELSKQSGVTIERANMYAEILQYATLDALTGLNNRRQFETRLKQEVATSKRKNKPLCCFMIDVDYFKKVNDTHGHVAGDCILKQLARVITTEIREYDIASRYGGEEFSILLPFTTLEEANFVAQRLRKSVENTSFDISEAKSDITHINITISLGIATLNPKNDTPKDLYQNADHALYQAKQLGRNRVIIFSDSE